MRRLPVLLAVLALLLMVAVPATAAPGTSGKYLTYHVMCDGGNHVPGDHVNGDHHWVVKAKGVPGFPVFANTPTAPPFLLMGGHFSITFGDGSKEEWHDPTPPGLEGKLMKCSIHGPEEDVGFHLMVDPAWILMPGTH